MIRVIIADDHAILRAGLKHMLTDYPDITVVGEAGNGAELIQRLHVEPCDVVLLDMTMPGPGRSGIDLIKQLRLLAPKLPILVLSMHKEDVYAVRAIRAGAAGYLCKDNAEEQLVTALRKVASGGLYISEAVAERLAQDLRRDDSDVPLHARLSDREYQIFQALVAGESPGEIAERLNLSIKTVSTHKAHILEKLHCQSVAELVRYAIEHGLMPAGSA